MNILYESNGYTTPKDIAELVISSDSLARHFNFEVNASGLDVPRIIDYEAVYSGIVFKAKHNEKDFSIILTAFVPQNGGDGEFTVQINDAPEYNTDTMEQVVVYIDKFLNDESEPVNNADSQ